MISSAQVLRDRYCPRRADFGALCKPRACNDWTGSRRQQDNFACGLAGKPSWSTGIVS